MKPRLQCIVIITLLTIANSRVGSQQPGKPIGMHQGVVQAIVFSPDGKLLATAGHEDRTVRVWNIAKGKEIRRLLGHTAAVQGVSFSPDGATVLSSGLQESVRSWDLDTGIESRSLLVPGHGFGVAVSPDGKRFATTGQDKDAHIWDMESGKVVHVLGGHPLRVWTIAFSPGGKHVATGCEDGNVRIWDAATGKEVRSFGDHGFSFCPIAFSPDGITLASGGADKTIRLWNFATGKELARIKVTNEVLGLAFSPDGGTLFSSALDEASVYLWEVATGKEVCRFEGHRLFAPCVAFAPHGRMAASAGRDGEVRVWDVTGRLKQGALMPAQPTAMELETLWKALVGDDAAAAYRAGWVLASAPDHTVPLFKKRLPLADPDPALAKRVAQLIVELDDDRFVVRDKASAELRKLGTRVSSALEAALLTKRTLEAQRRVALLLEAIPAQIIAPTDVPMSRAVTVLERIANEHAEAVLKQFASRPKEEFISRTAAAALRRLAQPRRIMPTARHDDNRPDSAY